MPSLLVSPVSLKPSLSGYNLSYDVLPHLLTKGADVSGDSEGRLGEGRQLLNTWRKAVNQVNTQQVYGAWRFMQCADPPPPPPDKDTV